MNKKRLLLIIMILLLAGLILSCGKGRSDNDAGSGNTRTDASFLRKGSEADDGDPDEDPDKDYSGKYEAVGLYINDCYVEDEMFDGWYLKLDDDGTGFMYFGEDNQGDISDWSMDGDSLTLKAGVSVFSGQSSIKNGILLLDFDNDTLIAFADPDVDRSSLNIVTLDEYSEEMGAE